MIWGLVIAGVISAARQDASGCAPGSCSAANGAIAVPFQCPNIRSAIGCIPSSSTATGTRYEITVAAGLYKEKLVFPADKGPVSLVGLGRPPVWPPAADADTAGVTVQWADASNCNDTTGRDNASDGCGSLVVHSDDFVLSGITVRNNLDGFEQGKNFAAYVTGDRMAVYRSAFQGKDDVVYTGDGTKRVYFSGCVINGSADFNFGSGAAVYDDCDIVAEPGQFWSFCTAHAGNCSGSGCGAGSDDGRSTYLIQNSRLPMAPGSRIGTTYLGRPWGASASVVYKNTWMDKHISPSGWTLFRGQRCASTASSCMETRFAEFNSTGPGANPAARVKWSRQLSASAAGDITQAAVLGGWVPPPEPRLADFVESFGWSSRSP